ncbi:3-deoxy-D-manno-octulosonic acid transferase [Aquicoccus sp. G2-2]|uniref:3-deoxy-D-manno-octulosonic acid transferase n=1 Tax=Aquicoccus sp. G2-2 TaxID=3092120 RepID=UPI002ADF1304|nr:glycosyltransferase N-terminal domain-containing protein [Aquicoccus sp. G2-2]MEA1114904.1 glycosyltransferase N-terminal domain-containing protein [Aquicoccus sp. G2-2]
MALTRSISLGAYLALARRDGQARLDFAMQRPVGTLLWGHATSPARARALLQIARLLRSQRPDLNLLITSPPKVNRPDHLRSQDFWQALPDDTLQAGDAFLDHWRPDICLWTGGQFRPALLHLMAKRHLPAFLIDASEDDLNAAHQRWLPDLARASVEAFGTCFARNGTAAQILRRLGVPREEIEVTGPLQEGSGALGCNDTERDELAQIFAGRPVWLAAMVQRSELEAVIAAHIQVSRRAIRLMLILVPDDETDGGEFADFLRAEGLNVAVWSRGDIPDETTQVLLADTWGEMGLWYRLAPLTFMGSSLDKSSDGRDPYEPAALGSAILYGPNVSRYLSAYSRFARAGAARIVKDTSSLATAVQQLLAPDQAALMAAAGWQAASEGAEVTDKVTALVHDVLDVMEAN